MKDKKEIQELFAKIKQYTETLKTYGIHDHLVSRKFANLLEEQRQKQVMLLILIGRVFMLIGFGIIWLPATILGLPFTVTTGIIARRQAKK